MSVKQKIRWVVVQVDEISGKQWTYSQHRTKRKAREMADLHNRNEFRPYRYNIRKKGGR